MKNVFEILKFWFLSSLVASFVTVLGSVIFVLGLGWLLGVDELQYFPGFEAFGAGFCIASIAAFIACVFLLLPCVFISVHGKEEIDLSMIAWVPGAPALFCPLMVISTHEPLLYLMAAAAVIFSFAGGWIFGKSFIYFYYQELDNQNDGFFERDVRRTTGQEME